MFKITRNRSFCLRIGNRLILSGSRQLSDEKGDGKTTPFDISSLFKEDEEETPTNTSLLNLMQNIKAKSKNTEKKQMIKKQIEERDKRNRELGEKFLFENEETKIIEKEEDKSEKGKPEKSVDIIYDTPKAENVEVPETREAFRVDKLKEDIDVKDDNRDVSKLMSALIDDIDKNVVNPEEKLKTLMNVMNKKASRRVENFANEETSKINILKDKRKGTKKRLSLTHGTTTNLFQGMVFQDSKQSQYKTLSEQNYVEELHNLLPQSVPQNSFEEMMLTIDKQWKFPIDNEQDMGIEEDTSFEEHVFLDHHLDEFPEEGPIKHFMELVITGLQQNPYLSVKQKQERVMWFKDYFKKFPDEDLII